MKALSLRTLIITAYECSSRLEVRKRVPELFSASYSAIKRVSIRHQMYFLQSLRARRVYQILAHVPTPGPSSASLLRYVTQHANEISPRLCTTGTIWCDEQC
jgi:hypothetical protein